MAALDVVMTVGAVVRTPDVLQAAARAYHTELLHGLEVRELVGGSQVLAILLPYLVRVLEPTSPTPAARPSHLDKPLLEDVHNWASDINTGFASVLNFARFSPAADALWTESAKLMHEYGALADPANVP